MKRVLINLARYVINRLKFKSSIILTPYIKGNCKLGFRSILNREVILENSSIDDYSYVNRSSIIINSQIGKYCSISYNCVIGAKEHNMKNISTSPIFETNENVSKTIIDDDVWIGTNVVIKAGVKIGRGSVIGAGSIVTKDVEPYSIYAGVPAKFIKSRLDYFNYENVEVIKNINFSENVSALIAINEKVKDKNL